jgi:enoyl-CoA hydratase/carnithine racemase
MSDELLVERKGAIATITVNRPEQRNAMNVSMWERMPMLFEELGRDADVRAIVLRGAGQQSFVSGADISEFEAVRKDSKTAKAYNAVLSRANRTIQACPKPTVAMIFGYCMGGGMTLATSCDLRFAAEGSTFAIPAGRLSIVYGVEATMPLVHLVGPSRAKEILFSARTLDSQEALAIGLVNRVLPTNELESFTYDYLHTVAANAPLTVRGAKAVIAAILKRDPAETQAADQLALSAFDSEDYREAVRAFLEKRSPRFQGR